MRNIKKTTLLALLVLLMISESKAQLLKVELIATGLTCSMCSNAIYKQLQTLPGVDSIDTDISTSSYVIWLKKDNNLTPKNFKEKVENAGFFIGTFKATTTLDLTSKNPYILLNDNNRKSETISFQVVDKEFVTKKVYKKLAKKYKNVKTYLANNENDFHIIIIN